MIRKCIEHRNAASLAFCLFNPGGREALGKRELDAAAASHSSMIHLVVHKLGGKRRASAWVESAARAGSISGLVHFRLADGSFDVDRCLEICTHEICDRSFPKSTMEVLQCWRCVRSNSASSGESWKTLSLTPLERSPSLSQFPMIRRQRQRGMRRKKKRRRRTTSRVLRLRSPWYSPPHAEEELVKFPYPSPHSTRPLPPRQRPSKEGPAGRPPGRCGIKNNIFLMRVIANTAIDSYNYYTHTRKQTVHLCASHTLLLIQQDQQASLSHRPNHLRGNNEMN